MVTTAAVVSIDLARLAARGDEEAFRQLVEFHHREILGLCYTITRDADLAAEAAQAAWIKAWRRLSSLREVERVRAWLCAIAANEARGLVRQRRRATVVPIETAYGLPGSASDDGELTWDLDLAAALARLAPEDRALLALRYVAGLNATELGAALGLSPSGTRARLARLLDRLRVELK